MCFILLALNVSLSAQTQDKPVTLRPPAVPLILHDPYFSIWSAADKLTDTTTTHWTGKPHPLRSLVRVDGRAYRVMGIDPPGVPALPQVNLSVLPTRTIYQFADERIHLKLTFLTPALPWHLDVFRGPFPIWSGRFMRRMAGSTPFSFISTAAELAVNTPDQRVVVCNDSTHDLRVLKLGSREQPILAKKGDDVRIDWGYLPGRAASGKADDGRLRRGPGARLFGESGTIAEQGITPGKPPVLAAGFDLGRVGPATETRTLLLEYDDVRSIQYFGSPAPAVLAPVGHERGFDLLDRARECSRLAPICRNFDDELMSDLTRSGGRQYALLCALAYRQTLAGNKLAADAHGHPLLFPKENFSNGCISTVDVLFPQAPFFLVFSPGCTRAMLVPILDYASSPRWPYSYAPHDLGTYPQPRARFTAWKAATAAACRWKNLAIC